MSLNKVIAAAREDLGYTELPAGSNRTKYWDAYDSRMQGQPWCVAALWYWFRQAGERMAFFGGSGTASCSVLLRWYREQGLAVAKEDVEAGDIAILNFKGTLETQHCGLVVDVQRLPNGDVSYVQTIEGNTSPGLEGSQDNGGCVALKVRYPRQIVAVCRPQYSPEPVLDYAGHWAEESIRWCIKQGLMKGYEDGTFKPDKPVTRAELATILKRLEGQ